MYVCNKLGSLPRLASDDSLQVSPLPIPFFLWTLGYEFESSNLAFVAKCLLTKSSSSNIINITYRDMSREASPSRLVDDTKACSWEIIYVTDLIYLIAKPSCHLLEPHY